MHRVSDRELNHLSAPELGRELSQVFAHQPELEHRPDTHDYQLTYPPAVQIERPQHRCDDEPERFAAAAIGNLRHVALYFHFGFCAYKCRYCFHYELTLQRDEALRRRYVDALLREARLMRERLGTLRHSYTFLGGGTPTALDAPLIERFLDGLTQTFGASPTGLCTVEAKPVTATREKLGLYVQAGFRRISFGVQTLDPELYAFHHHGEALAVVERALDTAREVGFRRVNIDLMTGLERQTPESWKLTLDTLRRLIARKRIDSVFIYPYHDDPRSKTFGRPGTLPPYLETVHSDAMARAMFEELGWWELGPRFYRSRSHVFDECRDLVRTRVSPWYGEFLYAGLGNSAFSVGDTAAWVNERDIRAYCERVESGRLGLSHWVALDDAQRAIRDLTFDILYSPVVRVRSLQRKYGSAALAGPTERLERWTQLGLGRWQRAFGTWRLTRLGKLVHQQMLPQLYLPDDSAEFRKVMNLRRELGRRYHGY